MDEERDQELEDTYYLAKDPGSFGGIQRLKDNTSKSQTEVTKFLRSQRTYQLHKQPKRKFKRRRYIVSGVDDLWQSDIADVQNLSRDNNGINFLLVVIDVFSKYLFVRPLKTKQGSEVKNALEGIIIASQRKPRNLQTDKGTEFVNQDVKAYLQGIGINFYQAQNPETKASVAERVIRTIKSRMYRYLTANKTKVYLPVLQDIVYSYNHSKHRSIGMKPADVTEANSKQVRAKLYQTNVVLVSKGYKFNVGDKVRITINLGTFTKGYQPQWTEEIFTVAKRKDTIPPTYRIEDAAQEPIIGSFYEPEMQLVTLTG